MAKLEAFILDGRIEISNNRAERAKASNLNAFYYLNYLFEKLPNKVSAKKVHTI